MIFKYNIYIFDNTVLIPINVGTAEKSRIIIVTNYLRIMHNIFL